MRHVLARRTKWPLEKFWCPLNFTRNDDNAIAFVIDRFSRQSDETQITLFHAYVPVPEIEISNKTIMSRMADNLAFLRQKHFELAETLDQAKTRLVNAGFTEQNVQCVFKPQAKEIAQEIIAQATKGHFTTIVLNHHPSKIRRYFTPSITKKVARAVKDIELSIVG